MRYSTYYASFASDVRIHPSQNVVNYESAKSVYVSKQRLDLYVCPRFSLLKISPGDPLWLGNSPMLTSSYERTELHELQKVGYIWDIAYVIVVTLNLPPTSKLQSQQMITRKGTFELIRNVVLSIERAHSLIDIFPPHFRC